MNQTGAPADCWLLCMTYVYYLLNHMSCEALKYSVPLTKLYGVVPDISILLLSTFSQSVSIATHNQSFPPLVKRELHLGLVLVNMLVMPLHRCSSRQIPGRSSPDLL